MNMNTESAFRYVGKSVPVIDAAEKVTGRALYAADIDLPGMLYAKYVGSPHPHARVVAISTEKAAAVPGVKAIITCFDVPNVQVAPAETKPLTLLTDHPRCLFDEVAAVAATTPEAAEEAAQLIDVTYEVLPAVFETDDALAEDAPQLYPEGNESGGPLRHEWGEVDETLRTSFAVASSTFRTQIQVPAPIEPRACVANWDGRDINVWSSTQFPHRVAANVATALSLPLSRVRVMVPNIGGGFGGKKEDRVPLIAALLSHKAGRPVKFEYTREDEQTITRRRHSTKTSMTLGCDRDGHITAIDFAGTYDVGAYGNHVGGSLEFLVTQLFVYKFPAGRFVAWDVNTNLVTAQPFRGVQAPAYHFALEQLLDELAEKVDMDPGDFRLNNMYRAGDAMQPFGMILGTFPINECVAKGKEAIGWDKKWRGWKAPRTQSRKQRGIGMGTSMGWGDWEREEVGMSVEVQKDGSVVLYTGTQDVGTDSKTSLIQLLAEALDTSIDKVCIVTGDTRTTPFDFGTCGSRVLFLGGQALLKAAEDVKDQILGLATEKLSVSPGVLRLRDGAVEDTRLGGKRIPIGELLQTSVFGYGSLGPEEMVAHLRPKYWVGGAAANFAEVEVDMETGEVEILNLVCAHDVGQAVNPAVVENQISGAAVQGIGYALTEQLRFDPEKNAYLESNYTDYKIPTIGDTGRIVPIIVEGPEPVGPYGAKCIGEIALNCTAAAIANAIRDAIGARLEELPMTAERVRKQIGTSVA